MPTTRQLELQIAKLPLSERQALLYNLEQSIIDEQDRLEDVSTWDETRLSESATAEPFSPGQLHELRARLAAAARGDANYVSWMQVRDAALGQLDSKK